MLKYAELYDKQFIAKDVQVPYEKILDVQKKIKTIPNYPNSKAKVLLDKRLAKIKKIGLFICCNIYLKN